MKKLNKNNIKMMLSTGLNYASVYSTFIAGGLPILVPETFSKPAFEFNWDKKHKRPKIKFN